MVSLLKTSNSSPFLLFAFLGVCTLAACATMYKPIHPDQMEMVHAQNTLIKDTVQIWWSTNVFHDTGNRRYAKRESKTGVSLALVRIRNLSLQQLILPDDLVFLTEFEEPIWPLSFEEALEVLIEPVDNKEPLFDVDSGLWRLGRTTNDVIKVKSSMDFINEMNIWYLASHGVKIDEELTGLIVLPVPASTQWSIRLRERD